MTGLGPFPALVANAFPPPPPPSPLCAQFVPNRGLREAIERWLSEHPEPGSGAPSRGDSFTSRHSGGRVHLALDVDSLGSPVPGGASSSPNGRGRVPSRSGSLGRRRSSSGGAAVSYPDITVSSGAMAGASLQDRVKAALAVLDPQLLPRRGGTAAGGAAVAAREVALVCQSEEGCAAVLAEGAPSTLLAALAMGRGGAPLPGDQARQAIFEALARVASWRAVVAQVLCRDTAPTLAAEALAERPRAPTGAQEPEDEAAEASGVRAAAATLLTALAAQGFRDVAATALSRAVAAPPLVALRTTIAEREARSAPAIARRERAVGGGVKGGGAAAHAHAVAAAAAAAAHATPSFAFPASASSALQAALDAETAAVAGLVAALGDPLLASPGAAPPAALQGAPEGLAELLAEGALGPRASKPAAGALRALARVPEPAGRAAVLDAVLSRTDDVPLAAWGLFTEVVEDSLEGLAPTGAVREAFERPCFRAAVERSAGAAAPAGARALHAALSVMCWEPYVRTNMGAGGWQPGLAAAGPLALPEARAAATLEAASRGALDAELARAEMAALFKLLKPSIRHALREGGAAELEAAAALVANIASSRSGETLSNAPTPPGAAAELRSGSATPGELTPRVPGYAEPLPISGLGGSGYVPAPSHSKTPRSLAQGLSKLTSKIAHTPRLGVSGPREAMLSRYDDLAEDLLRAIWRAGGAAAEAARAAGAAGGPRGPGASPFAPSPEERASLTSAYATAALPPAEAWWLASAAAVMALDDLLVSKGGRSEVKHAPEAVRAGAVSALRWIVGQSGAGGGKPDEHLESVAVRLVRDVTHDRKDPNRAPACYRMRRNWAA